MFNKHIKGKRIFLKGQVRWLMAVIPALWEVKASGSSDVKSSRPVWPTLRNPVSTKNTGLWWHMPLILPTQKTEAEELLEPQEVSVSQDCATALQPGQQEQDCQKKKN